jgi:hypothetical protein
LFVCLETRRFADWILYPAYARQFLFRLKMGKESSLQNVVFLNKKNSMENFQNCDSYFNAGLVVFSRNSQGTDVVNF